MAASQFVYVIYIRTTAEKLWEALTTPEFNRAFWFGTWQDCAWEKGASWKLTFPDGRIGDTGEVVEIDKPRRIVIKWRNEFRPELKAEGYSRCTFEIEQTGETAKLTVIHESDVPGSKLITAVSGGWPKILSGLKSLLETGAALPEMPATPK